MGWVVWFLSGEFFNFCSSYVNSVQLFLFVSFYWWLPCFCLPCKQALGRTCLMQKRKRKKPHMGALGSQRLFNMYNKWHWLGLFHIWWEHSIFFPVYCFFFFFPTLFLLPVFEPCHFFSRFPSTWVILPSDGICAWRSLKKLFLFFSLLWSAGFGTAELRVENLVFS